MREQPAAPVRAYDGVTELTEEALGRLVSELRGFLSFHRDQCRRYELPDPDSGVTAGTRASASSTISGR